MILEHWVQLVVDLWFEIQFTEFHDHFEGHEVNDAIADRIVERQQDQADYCGRNCLHALNETQEESDLASSVDKLMALLVGKFHDSHAILNFRRQQEVQG